MSNYIYCCWPASGKVKEQLGRLFPDVLNFDKGARGLSGPPGRPCCHLWDRSASVWPRMRTHTLNKQPTVLYHGKTGLGRDYSVAVPPHQCKLLSPPLMKAHHPRRTLCLWVPKLRAKCRPHSLPQIRLRLPHTMLE